MSNDPLARSRTSGLDPEKNQILEAGWAFARDEDPFTLLGPPQSLRVKHDEIMIGPFCLNMHTKNGLLSDIQRDGRPLLNVDAALEVQLNDRSPGVPVILAGSSIHFDRAFIKRHMPMTELRLHYRMLDVSSLKISRPDVKFEKVAAHRAGADILQSVADGKRIVETPWSE